MGRPAINMENSRVGRLLVIRKDINVIGKAGKHVRWICRCDCGNELSVMSHSLRSKKRASMSCGCYVSERLKKYNTTHGIYGTKLYWSIYGNLKRARKIQAIPKWADQKKINKFYKNRIDGHDVDHIVPLISDNVCGLHWEGNLQYLPKKENQSKKNRYWPDMWE